MRCFLHKYTQSYNENVSVSILQKEYSGVGTIRVDISVCKASDTVCMNV